MVEINDGAINKISLRPRNPSNSKEWNRKKKGRTDKMCIKGICDKKKAKTPVLSAGQGEDLQS